MRAGALEPFSSCAILCTYHRIWSGKCGNPNGFWKLKPTMQMFGKFHMLSYRTFVQNVLLCFGDCPLDARKVLALASKQSHDWAWRVTWTHMMAKAPRWCDHHLAKPADKGDPRISSLRFLGSLQFSLSLDQPHDEAISFHDRKRVGQNQILW